ncbi:MAG: SDR family oxidoreductase [Caldilineaceae bacterium]|nr:SDR family oxidoreductase [Caldilineaceae bacterium]
MSTLQGKSALVTGASSGFGQAIAVTFAAAGAQVALVGRDDARLQATAVQIIAQGGRALICAADIADEAQIQAAVEKAQVAFGPIDILVNNAGMNVTQRSIADTSVEQWRQLMDVNLTAAFIFTKLVLPGMVSRAAGTIINVASGAALHPHLAGGVAYSTSKMGMDSLTQVTNEEANPHNVRACLLCPGVGNTPLLDRRPKPPPQELRQKMLQPQDVADVALLVASMPPHVNIDLISVRPTHV